MRHRLVLAAGAALCVLTATSGQALAQTTEVRGMSPFQRNEPPKDAGPAPRSASGKMLLGGAPGEKNGLWTPLFSTANPILEFDQVPFQPWARALYVDRQSHELEPHARCKASGVARQFLTPYGVEFVDLGDRIYIFDEGGPHTFRTVYMDGRTHPKNIQPSYYGHSVGWWEGDTLVVESTGFNERFWFERRGLPHTESMRTLERFTRLSALGMKYEVTVDDPAVYTKPWTGWFYMRFNPELEPWEYVCQQANYAHELMVGNMESVDRSTTTVP
jgi:hypothetical protein